MQRVAGLLFLAGVVLLATWWWAPAAPPFAVAPQRATSDAVAESVSADMTAQVDRLRRRLAEVPDYPKPERDPFRFGARPEPARPVAAEPAAVPVVTEVAPVLPRLVAVMSSAANGAVTRRVAVAIGDDVRILNVGDVVGSLVVRSIDADSAELVDPATGATFRIR